MKIRKIGLSLVIIMTMLLVTLPKAEAATCQSAANIVTDLWNQYGDAAKQAGCSSNGNVDEQCIQEADKWERIVRTLITTWNAMANNQWPTLGPRDMQFGQVLNGTIVSPGSRLFITPAPVKPGADLEISLTKENFKSKTQVTVCKYPEIGPGGQFVGQKIWEFTIAGGTGNLGKTWTRKFTDIDRHLVSVNLQGQQALQRMEYRLIARLSEKADHTVVIASDNVPGGTDYTIKVTGSLSKASGTLDGFPVSINANDHIQGNTATGVVGSGSDGYHITGEISDIQLKDPSGARIYVDGQEYSAAGHSIVIDSSNIQGDTDYTLNFAGNIRKVDGTLDGYSVSRNAHDNIQGNTVKGYVGAADDGYTVSEIRGLELKTPNNAKVYIDGQEYGSANNSIVIDSANIQGDTDYTLKFTGSIRKVDGSLDGHSVSRNAHDNIQGNTVKGYVGAGADGYQVNGQIVDIQFANPNAAIVYVNGQKWSQ